MQCAIRGGRIIDPANDVDRVADLYIADGKIRGVGQAPKDFVTEREIDAAGKVVCPGLVDLSARLGALGDDREASTASEARAAVGAGITTLCCPPDTSPVIDIPAIAEQIHRESEEPSLAKVVCLGALTKDLAGERLAEMHALKQIGCVGVSNGSSPIINTEVLRRAMEYAATCDLTVFLHAEDYWLGHMGRMHEGPLSTRLGIPGIPEAAETVALSRDLLLVEQTGVRAHFCRLSTARGVEMVAEARARGLAITADAGVNYLELTYQAVEDFNSFCHVRPPFRSDADRLALIRGVADGAIDVICSDHQPHDLDAKTAPFSVTEPGISALDLLLPLSLKQVKASNLGLMTALAALTVRPAMILGLAAGTLSPGAAADICVFDPDYRWTLNDSTLLSAGKNTPYIGCEFQGRVTHTFIDGNLVYEAGGL